MYAMSYVLAISLVVQEPQADAVARAQRALAGLDGRLHEVGATLDLVRVNQLGHLDALSASLPGLSQLSEFAGLGQLGPFGELSTLGALSALGDMSALAGYSSLAPRALDDQDPGDSLYRAARQLLNRGRYAEAATTFVQLTKRYPRSEYTPDAYYWAAFALYRTGDTDNFREALSSLDVQRRRYPRAATLGDGRALEARIQGELARQGDPAAAEWVRRHAESAAMPPAPPTSPTPPASPTAPTPPTPPTSFGGRTTAQASCPSEDDDDPPMVALNALLQMDAEAAVPILEKVLARRDPCSARLRRKAVFIVSQKHTEGTEDILLAAARSDPDNEVREQAVFWLSQVGSERAVGALDSILQSARDVEIQKKAVFALSQIRGARGAEILRRYAGRGDAPVEVRAQAIFWLGQQRSADNAAFLRSLYAQVTDDDLKEKVIFSLSQMRSAENGQWLMDLALNEREPIDMRKKALFWAGQMGAPMGDLVSLYDRTTNQDMKEQLIFVYSQRHEPEALDKLIDIAKREANPDLRKKAVFWLGQSRDPRARQVLIDIINQ